jgi:hypothetical protein
VLADQAVARRVLRPVIVRRLLDLQGSKQDQPDNCQGAGEAYLLADQPGLHDL